MDSRPTLAASMDSDEARRLIALAHETEAFMRGEFTLTSGRKSDYYFDAKRITLHPEGAYLVGKSVATLAQGLGVDGVGGVAVGGYPMAAAAAAVSHVEGSPLPAFAVRDTAKGHGTKRQIEGHFTQGSRVAIVDDVLTTGGSVMKAIEAVEAMGGRVTGVIVLVDRGEGGGEALATRGYAVLAIMQITR